MSSDRIVRSAAAPPAEQSWPRSWNGYEVVEVEASWLATTHMFRDIGNAVEYACHDHWHCLHEGIAERVWEASGRATGFVLALTGFDVFANAHVDDAREFLSVFAGSR